MLVRCTDLFDLVPFDKDLSTSHSTNVIRPVYFSSSLSALIIQNVTVNAKPAHRVYNHVHKTLLHNDRGRFPTLPYSFPR